MHNLNSIELNDVGGIDTLLFVIYRHGVRQLRSGWADGPAYITQCPIQTGQTYVYNFIVTGQRGTLWWHAHISWIRASVYGAFIIYPKRHVPYPFPKPDKEVPMIIGRDDYIYIHVIDSPIFSYKRLIHQ